MSSINIVQKVAILTLSISSKLSSLELAFFKLSCYFDSFLVDLELAEEGFHLQSVH